MKIIPSYCQIDCSNTDQYFLTRKTDTTKSKTPTVINDKLPNTLGTNEFNPEYRNIQPKINKTVIAPIMAYSLLKTGI